MCTANANIQRARINRSFLGDDMDNISIATVLYILRKYVAPVLIGALVVWLVANELGAWAVAVCGVADALAIYVKDCGGLS